MLKPWKVKTVVADRIREEEAEAAAAAEANAAIDTQTASGSAASPTSRSVHPPEVPFAAAAGEARHRSASGGESAATIAAKNLRLPDGGSMELTLEEEQERQETAALLAAEDFDDTRERLIMEVLEAKDDLFWWWNDRDTDQSGRIHVKMWVDGMQACCSFRTVSWFVLNRHFQLADVDGEGFVNYVQFLTRYRGTFEGTRSGTAAADELMA